MSDKKYMTREGVVGFLRMLADNVESGDCRAGAVEFNGFFTEHREGTRFDLSAQYRAGNNGGMGFVRTLTSGTGDE
jgi:hypothetical protein